MSTSVSVVSISPSIIDCICQNSEVIVSRKVMLYANVQLHGPSMFAVKAKIYAVLYNPAGSIDFDETSSYWSAPKSS